MPGALPAEFNRDVRVEDSTPLCTDLDGTLLRTDASWESLASAMRSNLFIPIRCLTSALRGGRPALKRALAIQSMPSVELFPYNPAVLAFLRQESQKGRCLVLATAADETIANRVNQHLKLFDEVHASDGQVNLDGRRKADRLVARFGAKGFDYIGDSASDLPVWRQARSAYLVRPSSALKAAMPLRKPDFESDQKPLAPALIEALRPHQWSKNLLLFGPLIAAHGWNATSSWLRLLVLFVAFNFAASASYLLNDLVDLDSDRRNPVKCRRPLASGALPLRWGFGFCFLCLGAALLLAGALGTVCLALLSAYLVCTTWYSLALKKVPVLDVLVLASFYTFRLAGGAIVSRVVLSPWLLAFAMFFFFSLATAKRYAELVYQRAEGGPVNASRGYRTEDLPQLNGLGISSGYLSVLVLVLYINSEHISTLYRHPGIFWALCPILLYWISRLWLLTHRGEMHEDPVVFALKDRVSYALAGLTALVAALAGPR